MINKARWLVKEAQLRLKYMTSNNCIFCKIVEGEMKSKFIYEGSKVVAFADINPVAATATTLKTFVPCVKDASGDCPTGTFDKQTVINNANGNGTGTGLIQFGASTFNWSTQTVTNPYVGITTLAILTFAPTKERGTLRIKSANTKETIPEIILSFILLWKRATKPFIEFIEVKNIHLTIAIGKRIDVSYTCWSSANICP